LAIAKGYTVCCMANQRPTAKRKPPYRTTGLHIRTDQWELLTRVAFERRKRGDRASVSALIGDLIDGHKTKLEKELAAATR
jgi:hypothetical protein